jgi:hypothetical protein
MSSISFLNCWPEVQILSGTPFHLNGLEYINLQIIVFLAILPQNERPLQTAEIRHSPKWAVLVCGTDVANRPSIKAETQMIIFVG